MPKKDKEENDIAYDGEGNGDLKRRPNPGGPRRGVNPNGPGKVPNPAGP